MLIFTLIEKQNQDQAKASHALVGWSFGATRDLFHRTGFSRRPGSGLVWGRFGHVAFTVTIFLLSLHQLHLRSAGVRPQRLGTPALGDPPLQTNTRYLSEELCWQLSGGLCWFERSSEFEELTPHRSPGRLQTPHHQHSTLQDGLRRWLSRRKGSSHSWPQEVRQSWGCRDAALVVSKLSSYLQIESKRE